MTNDTQPHPQPAIHSEKLLTEAEAAKLLNVGRRTLSNWRWQGRGPTFSKLGGRMIRYRHCDLQTFADQGRSYADKQGRN